MKRTLLFLTFLLPASAFAGARTVELTLHPANASESAQKYRLLPRAEEQTDADAMPLYEKALRSLPGDLQMNEVGQWLRTPSDKLPVKQVQSTLEKLKPSLELLKQAGNCKRCNWPYWDGDTLSESLREYRSLACLLALQIHFLVSRGRYDEAIEDVRTGFAMARHLGEGPTILHGIIGIGVSARVCRQLELFVQQPDAPGLYQALQDLPQPFIDLAKLAKWEEPDTRETAFSLMNRLGRHITVLECVEAMRLHAAVNKGRFPNRLSDITQVPVPNDPVTGKPFAFSRTGSTAVLEIPAMGKETDRDVMRYELSLTE